MGGTSPGGGGGGYELGISGSTSSSATSGNGPNQFGNVTIGTSSNQNLWLILAGAAVAVAFILKGK